MEVADVIFVEAGVATWPSNGETSGDDQGSRLRHKNRLAAGTGLAEAGARGGGWCPGRRLVPPGRRLGAAEEEAGGR